MPDQRRFTNPWMRSISFARLLRILRVLHEHTGATARQLNDLVMERGICRTHRGGDPSVTTLYHYRNTLVQLGLAERRRRSLCVTDDPRVDTLLRCELPDTNEGLPDSAKEAFSELIIRNRDCRACFFDLFVSASSGYDLSAFRTLGSSAIWRRIGTGKTAVISMENKTRQTSMLLTSASQLRGVLYGIRYWARDELGLIEEFYQDGRGAVMYPLGSREQVHRSREVMADIIALCSPDAEWTTFSVRDLLVRLCEERRQPVADLFSGLTRLFTEHPGRVVLIPTSKDFATLSARSQQREDFELRGYYQDFTGRYVSHVRLHRSIKEVAA